MTERTFDDLTDHLHELSLDGSWPTTGDVQYGDGHATLLIEAVDWPEYKGMSFILSEDNYGFKNVQVFLSAELAQASFDNWITDDDDEEENDG
jgi:hypothetical protein